MAEETTSARNAEPEMIGDQIRVGDIRDAKNIAIGKEIQQTIYEGYTAEEVALLLAEARKTETAPAVAITIPPPPTPAKPPEISNFVGRDRELTHFIDLLESAHLAVIAGMAGVGKTALAATLVTLVAREPSRIFWHSFHEGEGIDGVVWGLAGFLAWHGKAELWNLLQSARLTGGQPPPTETLFDYLLQLVRDGNYLLCFDDFHHVDDDPMLNQLVERLRQALVAGHLSIVITSRRVPEFITLSQVEPVQGLSDRDAQRLLQAQGVTLTAAQVAQLYTLTTGNAEFLILASAALKNARDPEDLLEQLAASDDIERYLVKEVDDALTGQERTVMNALAALLGYAATRDAIEAVVDRGNLLRTLRGLAERHLLIVQETGAGRAYRQHDLVREFYYEMNSRRDRRKLHARAGEYYRNEEVDLLLAGIHYERAGETEEAARLATQDLWSIVNRGQIRPLRTLLEQVADGGLATELAIAVNLAKGQIYTLQAEAGLAEASLQAALTQIDSVADETQQRILAARACRNMGELLEERSPRAALTWLEQGLARLQGADPVEEAALYIRCGTIYFFLRRYEDAQATAEQGVSLLPNKLTPWHGIALRDLSGIYNSLGNFQRAIEYATQSIKIFEQLSDPVNQIMPTMNLAIAFFSAGNTQAGVTMFDTAATLAERIANKSAQAHIEINRGRAKLSMGDLEGAKRHLQTSLSLAREQTNKRAELYALLNLIDVYVDEEVWDTATYYLAQAESLAQELSDEHVSMMLWGLWSDVKLASGDIDGALESAEQRYILAVKLEEVVSQGISLAYLGKTLAAKEEYEQAFVKFSESLVLIGEGYPFAMALAKKDFGQALLAAGRATEGVQLLIEAQELFQTVDTVDEVEKINDLLIACNDIEQSSLNKEHKK